MRPQQLLLGTEANGSYALYMTEQIGFAGLGFMGSGIVLAVESGAAGSWMLSKRTPQVHVGYWEPEVYDRPATEKPGPDACILV